MLHAWFILTPAHLDMHNIAVLSTLLWTLSAPYRAPLCSYNLLEVSQPKMATPLVKMSLLFHCCSFSVFSLSSEFCASLQARRHSFHAFASHCGPYVLETSVILFTSIAKLSFFSHKTRSFLLDPVG
jgi:hypothetical protein